MRGFNKILIWGPSIIIMTTIFVLSSIPGQAIRQAGYGTQKYNINAHLLLYFFLCLAYYRGTKNVKVSMLLAFIFGVSDEFHQTFTPGRAWEYFDLLINSTGIIAAGIFIWRLLPILPTKLKNLLFLLQT